MFEIQLEDAVNRIKCAGTYIPDLYFQLIRDVLAGNIYWCSVCKRYGDYRN